MWIKVALTHKTMIACHEAEVNKIEAIQDNKS